MLALVVPRGAFGYGFAVELVDGGVADFTFQHAEAPRVQHAGYGPIAGDVFAVVPGVPFRIDPLRYRHPSDLEHRRHRAVRVLQTIGEDLLAENAGEVLADDPR